MTTTHRTLLVALMLGATAVLAAREIRACSCTNNHTVLEEFNAATLVFGGTVTDIQPVGDGFNEIVTLTPTIRWKGGLNASVQVVTGLNEGICGFPFAVGESYLVFAFPTTLNGQPAYMTHLCTMDGPLAGNSIVPQLPDPVLPVPVRVHSWGAVKSLYR